MGKVLVELFWMTAKLALLPIYVIIFMVVYIKYGVLRSEEVSLTYGTPIDEETYLDY